MKQNEGVSEFTLNSLTTESMIKEGKFSISATFIPCKDQEYRAGNFPRFHNFKNGFY